MLLTRPQRMDVRAPGWRMDLCRIKASVLYIHPAEACAFAGFVFLRCGGCVVRHAPRKYKARGPNPQEDRIISKVDDDKTRVNQMIRARQIRVVDEKGEQLGIMTPFEALRIAEERELDLVEVAASASPPVCRIMDYGKFKYEQSKRAKLSKKNQHVIVVKEIKYRPKIDKHDFDFKTNHVREFLEEGNKVKVTIMFRGREMAHPEFGREILQGVVDATKDLCSEPVKVQDIKLEGRNMAMVLSPSKHP